MYHRHPECFYGCNVTSIEITGKCNISYLIFTMFTMNSLISYHMLNDIAYIGCKIKFNVRSTSNT